MFCKCPLEFAEERRHLERLGIEVEGLHPWEIQLPTVLELEYRGRSKAELEYWVERFRKIRQREADRIDHLNPRNEKGAHDPLGG